MAESNKKRKPGQNQGNWEVVTVGGENPTYSVPEGNTSINGAVTVPENPEPKPTPEENAQTAIDELRSRYMAELREEFERAMNLLRGERDEALRENWILQQQAKAVLPEQLAAAGINGGAAETTLAELSAGYQGERNDINSGYFEELGELSAKQSEKKADAEKDYMEKWIEYLMNIAKAEKEHELEKKYG
ncbi:MAG: hypothetical protein IKL57_07735 [Oscillospiraceae bacterium]|nr:hypothetical protein [Oscillospiraceae bacterium]